MVSSPMTVAGLTWNAVSAYTPVAMTRSWIRATKAAMAIFHSKAIVRYSTITIRNAMSASTALVVIWLPQLDPTNWTLMFFALSLLCSVFSTVLVALLLSAGVCTCQDLPRGPLSSCTIAPLTPSLDTTSWTWVTDADGAENWKTAPPLKSTLKSRQRTSSATMLISRMAPEIEYHVRFRPTKLTDTSPRYSRPPTLPRRDIRPPRCYGMLGSAARPRACAGPGCGS